ncbi:MAG: ATP-binding protein [Fimbriimonadaceae bacterium]|nr:ATP-binding protein [Fimbriimonadaceae bacterium]
MKLSHRARLAAVATGTAALVLALLFAGVFWISRRSDDVRAERELRATLELLTQEGSPALEFSELRSAHPLVSAALFGPGGAAGDQIGNLALKPVVGSLVDGTTLSIGKPWNGGSLVVGLDLRASRASSRNLGWVLTLLWLPLSVLVGTATWIAAQAVFRPLLRMTAQASAIEGADLGARLSTDDEAEFGAFARQLNAMLDRIQETIEREERFAVDAAHELRTPLALMQTRIETTLLKARTPQEYSDSHVELLHEVQRMARTIESLLRTARRTVSDAGPIDLAGALADILGPWRSRLEARGVSLLVQLPPEGLIVVIEPDELRIVVDNLLDNAARFTGQGGSVRVEAAAEGDQATVVVEDDGPGIPAGFSNEVFGRFVRVDDSRNRAWGGAGIGLAVCRQLLEARGGSIRVEPSDQGARLRVALPLVRAET